MCVCVFFYLFICGISRKGLEGVCVLMAGAAANINAGIESLAVCECVHVHAHVGGLRRSWRRHYGNCN